MNDQYIAGWLASHAKYFDSAALPYIEQALYEMDDRNYIALNSIQLNEPSMVFVVSLLVGGLGIDRFIIGDVGMGILKLFTGGCFGVLTIVDWFRIMGRTRTKNYDRFMEFVAYCNGGNYTPHLNGDAFSSSFIRQDRQADYSNQNFCPNCGNPLEPGETYCHVCGYKVL